MSHSQALDRLRYTIGITAAASTMLHVAACSMEAQKPPKPPGSDPLELATWCSVRPFPRYPVASRQMGERGWVTIAALIDQFGHIKSLLVAKSSGYPRLDQAALDAVMQWQCEPMLKDGKPIADVMVEPFTFRLNEP